MKRDFSQSKNEDFGFGYAKVKDETATKSIYKKELSKKKQPILKEGASGRGYIHSESTFSKWFDKEERLVRYINTDEDGNLDWHDHFVHFDLGDQDDLLFLSPSPSPLFSLHLRASFFLDSFDALSDATIILASSDDMLVYIDNKLVFDNGGKKKFLKKKKKKKKI